MFSTFEGTITATAKLSVDLANTQTLSTIGCNFKTPSTEKEQYFTLI